MSIKLRRTKHGLLKIASSSALALPALLFHPALASAQTVYGQIYVTNNTPYTFMDLTSSVSGTWSTANQPQNNSYYDGWTVGGAPANIIGPGQTIIFESQSNGGVSTGTGGSLTIPNIGTISYTVPWGAFHGLPNTYCDSSISAQSGYTIGNLSGGSGNTTGPNECPFYFTISTSPATAQSLTAGTLAPGQALAQGTSFTSIANSDGTRSLDLQKSGNLAFIDHTVNPPATIWSSNTTTGDVAQVGGDGNFVLYDISGNPIWQSYTSGAQASTLYIGPWDVNAMLLYSSSAGFTSWMSPGGYDPNTAVWWNQSYDFNSPALADWNYGSYKGTCLTGEPVVGVSRYVNALQSHDVECGGARYATTASQCYLRSLKSNDNRGDTDNGWDWDSGNYKLECASGEYVQGVSQSTSGQLDGILCCPGQSYIGGRAQALQHRNCDAQVFYNGPSPADSGPDWDYGYYKGQCPGGQYVSGISSPAYTSVGAIGAAHGLLCCSPQ